MCSSAAAAIVKKRLQHLGRRLETGKSRTPIDQLPGLMATVISKLLFLPIPSTSTPKPGGYQVGDVVSDAVFSDGSFKVPSLALHRGALAGQLKVQASSLDGAISTRRQCLRNVSADLV